MSHSSSLLSNLLLFTLGRTKAKLPVQKNSRAAGQEVIFPETMLLRGSKAWFPLVWTSPAFKYSPYCLSFLVPSPWTNSQLFSNEQVSKLNYWEGIWFGRVCVCHTHCKSTYFTKGDCFHPNNAQLSHLLWVRVTSLSGWTFKLWLSRTVIGAVRDHL